MGFTPVTWERVTHTWPKWGYDRLPLLYFKDLGQLDKNVGELLPHEIEGLVQDGHL